jgi:hypothetical protein
MVGDIFIFSTFLVSYSLYGGSTCCIRLLVKWAACF